jgi:DNA-binding transcriptional ArsR family regulator
LDNRIAGLLKSLASGILGLPLISMFREFSKRGSMLDRNGRFAVDGHSMDEIKFRESRVCRLLGNPVIYQLVLFLENGGPLTPSKLAKFAGRSVQTVSGHLAKLRAADLVRYNTDGKQVRYWLKHKRETSKLLKALETIVHSSSELS